MRISGRNSTAKEISTMSNSGEDNSALRQGEQNDTDAVAEVPSINNQDSHIFASHEMLASQE
jgi:hypothetical protein